jgi:hypothetical protein
VGAVVAAGEPLAHATGTVVANTNKVTTRYNGRFIFFLTPLLKDDMDNYLSP